MMLDSGQALKMWVIDCGLGLAVAPVQFIEVFTYIHDGHDFKDY